MEPKRMTDRRRRRSREGAFRAWLLSGASAAVLLAAGPALAQVPAEERVYRAEALAHAGAVETAWRRLETYILDESASPAGWTGAVPPAEAGWQAEWTERGLEARYCEDTLLVYLAPERLKGTGPDHRAVHAAPHAYGGGGRPVLHWLQNGAAKGGEGRGAVTLPACLSEAEAGGALPSGRAALAGKVRDPFGHTVDRVTRERRQESCPAGEHGEGRTLVREVTRTENGRGDPVGDPAHGPWEVLIELCRADYRQWEHYTLACHWETGPPHDRRMEGREVWRRLRTVTAAGETLGPPEFVSTSCWTGDAAPQPPEPEVSETSHRETTSGACPAGYTGSLGYGRTVTLRSTRFPWDEAPVTQTIRGAWVLERDDCVEEVEPDPEPADPEPEGDDPGPEESDPGPEGGDPEPEIGDPAPDGGDSAPDGGDPGHDDGHSGHDSGDSGYDGGESGYDGGGPDGGDDSGGTAGPSGDTCGGGDQAGTGPGEDTCSADDSGGDSGGGDGGGDDGCFLTTAVTERRGEADDGPTLTALRGFRDGYMTRTAERRALVGQYYAIAPAIVSAIPPRHAEWGRIADEIDAAVAAVAAGADDTAFGIYAAMMRRLEARWFAGEAVRDGGRP